MVASFPPNCTRSFAQTKLILGQVKAPPRIQSIQFIQFTKYIIWYFSLYKTPLELGITPPRRGSIAIAI